MKIILTHSYFIEEDLVEQKIMKPYPPLGMLYVSAFLKKYGIQTKVLDSTFISKAEWKKYMDVEQPDLVLFYANLITKKNTLELARYLRSVSDKITIVAGGPDVTYNSENYLRNGFDYLIIGEGEETSLEFVKSLKQGVSPNSIPGLAYLQNNELVINRPRIKMKQLEDLPLPDRDAINFEQYLNTWENHHSIRMASLSTQRGCPYTCKWCSTAVYGQSYRRRPPKLVVEEIKSLINIYNVQGIWFVDDVFTVSHKWLKSLHEEIKNQAISIQFECITRAERLNDEILDILKDMGCFRIWIGAESGSQKIINAMDRKVDIHKVREMINLTQKKGMQAGTFIMVGYPGEGLKEVKETVEHLKLATPSHLTATIAYPINGTSLYEEVKDQLTTEIDWPNQTDRELDFMRKHPRKFYGYALRYILNKYRYFSQKGIRKLTYAFKAQILYGLMLMSR